MYYKSHNIPNDWMIGDVHLSLFLKKEKGNKHMVIQNFCFAPKETDFINESLTNFLTGNKSGKDNMTNNSILLLSPTANFYSIDEFYFNGISFTDNTINVNIDYIWIEDLDGNPFNIIPVFIIPLNNEITKCKKLIANFNSDKKDFYTGIISKNQNKDIPSISIKF